MHTFPTKMILLPFKTRAFFQHQDIFHIISNELLICHTQCPRSYLKKCSAKQKIKWFWYFQFIPRQGGEGGSTFIIVLWCSCMGTYCNAGKEKRAFVTTNYEKILPSKHEEQFPILSTSNSFPYICPCLRQYGGQLYNILMKEWTFLFSTFCHWWVAWIKLNNAGEDDQQSDGIKEMSDFKQH